ncbi:MAG: DNA translocase FtsK [Ruminococcaceae bacterium]|nr:DNA translocase FtsK [Oscillospiraceae bacterium]
MGAVVFIDAGSLWGMLRNLFFGLFGLTAFILPIFILFVSIVSAIGKDSRKYKIKVTESFIIFVLLIAFLHIVNSQPELTYGEQISEAYNVFKEFDGTGMHYGYGVFGAIVGGLPLLMTAGNKLAAGIVVVLVLLALLMLFTGTTVLKLISSLKKPAEVAAEYAGEKMEDFKETYETVSEDIHEKRARNAAKRRKESKHQIELDVPIDDEIPADKGVEPILDTTPVPDEEEIELLGSFEEEPPMDVQSLDELFSNKTLAETHFEEVVEAFEEEVQAEPVVEGLTEETEPIKETGDNVVVEASVPEVIYELPPLDCLDKPKLNSNTGSAEELRQRGETIVKTLKSFGVGTRIVDICQSPSVTRFELQPDPGVKISKITALADDIAMNLAAYGVRIEAPIPNKNAVGIEVPNAEKAMVTLREILESTSFQNSKSKLNVALGRDIQGEATCADLAKMPHLLVAGTTGSGKSVCLNTMIVSLLYNAKPDEVKLIMIDPKKVEFTVYRSIPHLLVPVVADPRKAAGALSWAVAEMDKRYALFADNGVRNLQGYNNYALAEGLPKMPQIVIIIDELSDLMMAASNEVEDSICRLAQKARAAGMHLIVATQRPSVDVITGLIKANIPSRIAFAVKSQIDSRTIIDTQGAEKLLGNGDMLYCPVGLSKPVRVQGSYVSDEEIERVIDFVTSQGEVKYDDAVMQEIELKAAQDGKKKSGSAVDTDNMGAGGDYDDEMFPKAVEVVVEAGMASTTLLQRKLKLGYARAARIVDELSEKGIIGPFEGSKPRKVLITKEQWYQMQANSSVSVPKQLSVDDIEVASVPQEETKQAEEPNYFGSAVNSNNYDVEE